MTKLTNSKSIKSTLPLLQKWKRNQIFEAIQKAGLDPREFELKEVESETLLKHMWSESYFILGGDTGKYFGRYVAGDNVDWPYEVYSWDTLMTRVKRWLGEVKSDLETPDLWKELQRETQLLGIISDDAVENTTFTAGEQKEIAQRLQELSKYVRTTYSLSAEQIKAQEAKINYLIDASKRLGRTDWRAVFVGVIISYALQVAIPPESARSILLTFMAFLQDIAHVYTHVLPR